MRKLMVGVAVGFYLLTNIFVLLAVAIDNARFEPVFGVLAVTAGLFPFIFALSVMSDNWNRWD